MFYRSLILFSSLGVACGDPATQGDSSDDIGVETGESSGQDTEESIAWDRDQDGYTEDQDCNDYDEDVYPGAEENWNAVDDDCDGRIDADGVYTGSIPMNGTVVIEGVESSFSLSCPTHMVRDSATLEMEISCTATEPEAIEIIGEELILSVSDSGLSGADWDGRGELSSSQGWSTSIVEVDIQWVDFAQAEVNAVMASSTASLSLSASGVLDVESP